MSALTGKGFVTAGGFNPGTVGASAIFDGSADYMSQTPSAGNSDRFICGAWVLRTAFAGNFIILGAGTTSNYFELGFDANDKLYCRSQTGGVADFFYVTNGVYRDVGWYHVVFSYENGEGLLYANGDLPSLATDTDASAGTDAQWNKAVIHTIARYPHTTSGYFNGYVAQPFNLDAKSIQNGDYAITDFGQTFTAGTNGTIWSPKPDASIAALAAAAGGNSFCLTDSIAAGTDASSNGNNFTPSGSPTATGHTPSKIYPIFSPLIKTGAAHTITNGGRTIQGNNTTPRGNVPLFAIPANSGKWYFEFRQTGSAATAAIIGIYTEITKQGASSQRYYWPGGSGGANDSAGIGGGSGTTTLNYYEDGAVSSTRTYTVPTQTTSTVYQVAFDSDTREFWFGIDDSYLDSSTGLTGNPSAGTQPTGTLNESETGFYYPGYGGSTPGEVTFYFPSSDWTYSAPTGFKEWTSANLTAPTYQGADWFSATAYSGDGGARSFTGRGFQPDFVWLKDRNAGVGHLLFDAVRGTGNALFTHATNAETATPAQGYLNSFDADGWSGIDGSSGDNNYNEATYTYVDWDWRGDGTSGSSNTDGSITSTVNVAAPGHFSIVAYTGDNTSAQTIGHGLPGAPEFFIVKRRDIASPDYWTTWHKSFASNQHLPLTTVAVQTDTSIFNGTPTATTFPVSIGANSANVNATGGTYIAYCFRSVPGVCKVGSYVGNGSTDGPYVHLGFKPRWLLMKRTNGVASWFVWDTARDTYNPLDSYLIPNLANAEATLAWIDALSGGFKLRSITSIDLNTSGGTYIYLAMADVAGNGILPPIPGR